MHIKDLTSRILELGIVKSNCATSLETLLYRQTSGGSQGTKGNSRVVTGPSKFTRVSGKHGWFGLKPSALQEESDFNISLESIDEILLDEKNSRFEQATGFQLHSNIALNVGGKFMVCVCHRCTLKLTSHNNP